MPTYEYECSKCGKVFEVFQSITAEPLTKCTDETCSGPVRRLLSGGAGFLFKGNGFYITDYRSDSYKKAAEAEKKPAESSAGTDTKSKKTGASEGGGTAKSSASSGTDSSAKKD
ncbi:MAG: zinc ribbon domain-containing protein [Chitinivibrionales bacterium]|nr:zinc ribbon domain-containing protein [Chitinivibrionales bacterium]MBD3394165.1 zinc ribbon domain-containing protein [Chitinivibrionales bacterium]